MVSVQESLESELLAQVNEAPPYRAALGFQICGFPVLPRHGHSTTPLSPSQLCVEYPPHGEAAGIRVGLGDLIKAEATREPYRSALLTTLFDAVDIVGEDDQIVSMLYRLVPTGDDFDDEVGETELKVRDPRTGEIVAALRFGGSTILPPVRSGPNSLALSGPGPFPRVFWSELRGRFCYGAALGLVASYRPADKDDQVAYDLALAALMGTQPEHVRVPFVRDYAGFVGAVARDLERAVEEVVPLDPVIFRLQSDGITCLNCLLSGRYGKATDPVV